jgi:rhodanese-related sulfurtransferase
MLELSGVPWSPNSGRPMVDHISRKELIRLIDVDGIQVVDVLPEGEFQGGHIPGAVNIPLKTLDGEATQNLSKTKPVAVC